MNKKTRIQKLAFVLLVIDTAFLCIFALTAAFVVVQVVMGPDFLIADIAPEFAFPENTAASIIAASVFLLLLMFGAICYTMWQMRNLFARYAKGESLTVGCAEAIRKTGVGLIWIVILDIIMTPVQSFLMSTAKTPGTVSIEVDISAASIGLLLAGGLIVLVGWVMREAVEVAEENARFV